jgi:glycosyltransferase involved in cell wall biosynthesis
MNRNLKVTLGLCVKNAGATVAHVIKSIMDQDYPNELMELIVVDGNSVDDTLAVIKHYLLKGTIGTKFFCENKGLGLARQIVVANALGDYIVWVDGDTILPRDYIRKQVEFMDKHVDAGIGRAKYGILSKAGAVAFLENMPFVVESLKYGEQVPLGMCGTGGAIYRTTAIKQVRGFNVNIRGACEDIELANRMLNAGWRALAAPAVFYGLCRASWTALWHEYFLGGYGGHYAFHRDNSSFALYQMSPIAGFLAGILRLAPAYKLTHRKCLVLLPIHYAFKRTAWWLGFIKAHFDGYGHDLIEMTK